MIGKTIFLTVMALATAFIVCAHSAGTTRVNVAPRQMWSITSAVPTTAKIVIGRVEAWNGKVAVHVSVIDIPVPPGAPGDNGLINIDHVPFDESALAASVDHFLAVDVSPTSGFERGYERTGTPASSRLASRKRSHSCLKGSSGLGPNQTAGGYLLTRKTLLRRHDMLGQRCRLGNSMT